MCAVQLVCDDKAVAWRVVLDQTPCENVNPHVTMARRGCAPEYSNELLEREAVDASLDIRIRGRVTRH